VEIREQPCVAHVQSIVINWHVVEACNFACRYCYAKWDTPADTRDVIRDEVKTRSLLEELASFFVSRAVGHAVVDSLRWQRVRLNFAGGEPLLYGNAVAKAAAYAQTLGMDVSIITNGSRLTPTLMTQLAPSLCLLGVSVDSFSQESNSAIGRRDRRSGQLDIDQLREALDLGRRINPGLQVKLNTVVSHINFKEDLTSLVQALKPDRWKVLRVLPVQGPDLMVGADDFRRFVRRHEAWAEIMSVEDNCDMTESYLMVDPYARFFQNRSAQPGAGYVYSPPILEVGAASAFGAVPFDSGRFASRYAVGSREKRL
jgi:radical S-adenosyl methionine domain-containing protein 2